jgi:hypothetical protein
MPQPIVTARVGNLNLGVTEAQARAFAQSWDSGGIKMILDSTTISFANAWANIALKSALENPQVQMEIFKHVYGELQKAKAPAQPAPEPTPAPTSGIPPKSGIILTD